MTTAFTVREALLRASSLLSGATPSPLLDARVLLADILGADMVHLYAHPDRVLTAGETDSFMSRVRRRRAGEPAAYITGEKEFMGLSFRVTPAVLIPRPETEVLVEAVLAALPPGPLHLLDVGTGSGAIALSLAHLHPAIQATGIDISLEALEVARENARRHRLASRVRFVPGDLFPPLPASPPYNLVVANPPYIPSGDLPRLPLDVRGYEPRCALDGGPDGLSFFRRLLPPPPGLLAPGGVLALEVGYGQAAAVVSLFSTVSVKIIKDYAGVDRVVLFRP